MVVACYRAINIRHRHRVHQVRFPTARSDKREDSGLGHGGVWPDFHSCGLQQREIPCGPTGELRTTEEGTSLSKVWFTISSRCHMKGIKTNAFRSRINNSVIRIILSSQGSANRLHTVVRFAKDYRSGYGITRDRFFAWMFGQTVSLRELSEHRMPRQKKPNGMTG
jgi:hypothetical protein